MNAEECNVKSQPILRSYIFKQNGHGFSLNIYGELFAYHRLQEGNRYQYVLVISLVAQAQHTRFLQDGLIFGRCLHINLWMGMREMITYTVENLRSSRSCQQDVPKKKKKISFIHIG